MTRFWSRFLTAAALGCLLALWTLPASAYYPPLQATATVEAGKVGVTYKVWDPKLNKNQEQLSGKYWDNTVVDCKQDNGVIAWVFHHPDGTYYVFCCVYDPGLGKFVEKIIGPLNIDGIPQLQVKDGVVAWIVQNKDLTRFVDCWTYDPGNGGWQQTGFNNWGNGTITNMDIIALKDGLVVVKFSMAGGSGSSIAWSIYDPVYKAWARWMDTGYEGAGIVPSPVTINNATISFSQTITTEVKPGIFSEGTVDWVIGYRPDYVAPYVPKVTDWNLGNNMTYGKPLLPTNLLAYFAATPTHGPSPLWVWFTDMSIAATSWTWWFDQKNTSSQRSGYHTYTQSGVYNSQLKVKGAGAGTSQYSKGIYVDIQPPWFAAYASMASEEDLGLLRQYRDEVLSKNPKGKIYKEQLYDNSGAALDVLLNNLELMAQARNLLQTNRGAVIQVLQGHEGTIYDPEAVLAYLQSFGEKSPPQLRSLINVVEKEIRQSQQEGKPFLGFRFTKKD